MGFFDDVLDAMLTGDPGARAALRGARRVADAQRTTEQEVVVLRKEVAALQRVVAALARTMAKHHHGDQGAFEHELLSAVRGASNVHDEDEPSSGKPEGSFDLGAGPYRGPSPDGLSGRFVRCGACGKSIDPTDPELRLSAPGRVCMSCFQRGGTR